jgi:hypothetical protein
VAGGSEHLSAIELTSAGRYFVRVRGSSTNVQLYELALAAASFSLVLPGDYNNDGAVDAADYVVWRQNQGQIGSGLLADGNGDGIVDFSDFSIWRANFGRSPGTSSTIAAAVPEPHQGMLVWIGALVFTIQCAHVSRRNA